MLRRKIARKLIGRAAPSCNPLPANSLHITMMRIGFVLLVVLVANAAPGVAHAQAGGRGGSPAAPTVIAATPSDPLAALRFRGVGPAFTSGRHADMAVDPRNPHVVCRHGRGRAVEDDPGSKSGRPDSNQ
jgi:hypothetical protein